MITHALTGVQYAPTIDDASCIYAGCMDPFAVNHINNATQDDGSCDYEGCTDPAATNYTLITHFTTGVQYAPIIDDGSCLYGPAVPGCMDPDAVNHSSFATVDDGSCDFEGCTNPIASNYTLISHAITGVLYAPTVDDFSCIIPGCMDPNAVNHNNGVNAATTDDGSCEYEGCTDPLASNYTLITHATTGVQYPPTIDDGSCVYFAPGGPPISGCAGNCADPGANVSGPGCCDPTALNYNPNATCDDNSCIPVLYGCLDDTAANYSPTSNSDDGTCLFAGCTDPAAVNYVATVVHAIDGNTYPVTIDDGSCQYPF